MKRKKEKSIKKKSKKVGKSKKRREKEKVKETHVKMLKMIQIKSVEFSYSNRKSLKVVHKDALNFDKY